jgi:hypothetical protein
MGVKKTIIQQNLANKNAQKSRFSQTQPSVLITERLQNFSKAPQLL